MLLLAVSAGAQQETGVGARALALGNNHAALSSGVADLYWNPGALGFSVSREFQASLYGVKLSSTSDFFRTARDESLQRFRMGNAGFSFAVPATRGGMSFAFSYSNPVILDDVFKFQGSYGLEGEEYSAERSQRGSGNLNYWTGGFGIQVVENLSLGLAASLVTGRESADMWYRLDCESDPDIEPVLDDYSSVRRYAGYDLRAGVLYSTKLFNAGLRFVAPQILRYRDRLDGIYDNESIDATDKYRIYSSYKGALGAAVTLPFITVSAEARSTMPFGYLFPVEDMDNSQASIFKNGVGAGVEVPLVAIPLILRAGYSFDMLDLHPWVYDYLEPYENKRTIDWSDNGMKVNRNLHRIGAGFGITTASTSFDLSYGFSTWGITTKSHLEQIYVRHRVLASMAVRF